jgi:hypothetical protein
MLKSVAEGCLDITSDHWITSDPPGVGGGGDPLPLDLVPNTYTGHCSMVQ